jgi:hypothetical protein
MNPTAKTMLRSLCATTAFAIALFASESLPTGTSTSWTTSAQAIIGRPLTPMSYAGVARRTTRRAVAAGAAMAPVVVAPPPVVVAPACYQAVDVYGRVYMRCP